MSNSINTTPLTETVEVSSAPAPEMGFAHFIAQSDAVGKGLFIILVLMSLVLA